MHGKVPSGRLRRAVIGGGTVARVGANVAGYLAKRPFLGEDSRREAREKADAENARILFSCFSRLKGAALKAAQLLSMELELMPEAVRKELEKSYNQVPPMNRVLARKAAANALGEAPERVFREFDGKAFAAASLGQVHEALSMEGERLAVKLQYPGIAQTIEDDMRLARSLLCRLPDYALIAPAFDEIEARLREEIDYGKEARNMVFFRDNLDVEGVRIPAFREVGSGRTILCATLLRGLPLNRWLATNPKRKDRDVVARRLNAIFLKSFYELGRIHADPNPGNYVIGEDLSVGLVDFGCVKIFSAEFVEEYRQLPGIIIRGDRTAYFAALRRMRFTKDELNPDVEEAIFETAYAFGRWLGRLYENEYFDFGKETGFIAEGRELTRAMFRHRKHFAMNPEFVFLDRTRYGLLRIFERLACRIRLRNPYEWDKEKTHV